MKMKELSSFCRRVGICVNAGLGLLESVKREAPRQRNAKLWTDVAASIEHGESFTEALRKHEKELGEMFVALIEVGEESGHLGETLNEMADYYDEMLRIRREFLKSLTWPVIELGAAIVVVGLLILLLGFIADITGTRVDLLGFGLVGVSGFVRYVLFVTAVGAGGLLIYLWMKKNISRSRPVHYLLDRIPKLRHVFRTLSLMKLTWAMHLTFRTGMDVRRALTLSFRASGYAPVADRLRMVLEVIDCGGTITDAFMAGGKFDPDLITDIDTGEQSGNLPELMEKSSQRYLQETLLNMKVVTTVGGFLVYGCIMAGIAVIIFRIVMTAYIGPINEALQGI